MGLIEATTKSNSTESCRIVGIFSMIVLGVCCGAQIDETVVVGYIVYVVDHCEHAMDIEPSKLMGSVAMTQQAYFNVAF